MKAIEIEIDGHHNECLYFRPLQRKVRGRFDLLRMGEPMSKMKTTEWPAAIPSQRIGIDPDGTGYISEPLHDEEHAPLKEKIEIRHMRLEPATQTYEEIHLPSWLFWIKRAVESGLARVTKGQLPDKIDGEPRKNFVMADQPKGAVDKLTDAIDQQNALFKQLLSKLAEKA